MLGRYGSFSCFSIYLRALYIMCKQCIRNQKPSQPWKLGTAWSNFRSDRYVPSRSTFAAITFDITLSALHLLHPTSSLIATFLPADTTRATSTYNSNYETLSSKGRRGGARKEATRSRARAACRQETPQWDAQSATGQERPAQCHVRTS